MLVVAEGPPDKRAGALTSLKGHTMSRHDWQHRAYKYTN